MVRPALIAALFACACGDHSTHYWLLTTSTLEFNSYCSDYSKFREQYTALTFKPMTYIIYRDSADRRKATRMSCVSLDPDSCTPDKSGIVFDVDAAGKELSYSSELRSATGQGMCTLLTSETWLLADNGSTMDLSISDTLSLVDDPPTCDRIEMDTKTISPNGMGYQGCTISYRIGGSSR